MKQKIVFVGDSGTGKTSLVRALLNRGSREASEATTAGIEFAADDRFSFIDLSGDLSAVPFKKKTLRDGYDLAVVVINPIHNDGYLYDVLHRRLPNMFYNSAPPDHRVHFLVGTHQDQWRPIDRNRFVEFGRSLDFDKSFATSSATNSGVEELREAILGMLQRLRVSRMITRSTINPSRQRLGHLPRCFANSLPRILTFLIKSNGAILKE